MSTAGRDPSSCMKLKSSSITFDPLQVTNDHRGAHGSELAVHPLYTRGHVDAFTAALMPSSPWAVPGGGEGLGGGCGGGEGGCGQLMFSIVPVKTTLPDVEKEPGKGPHNDGLLDATRRVRAVMPLAHSNGRVLTSRLLAIVSCFRLERADHAGGKVPVSMEFWRFSSVS